MSANSLAAKRTQQLSRDELKQVLAVARGDQPADLLLKNLRVLDLGGCYRLTDDVLG